MVNLNNETWKNIKEFEDYQVSNYGNIKSFHNGKEKILKQGKNNKGYLSVGLCKNGKQKVIRGDRVWLLMTKTILNL